MTINFEYKYDLDMYMSEGFRSVYISGKGKLDVDNIPMKNSEEFLSKEQVEDYLKYDILEDFVDFPSVEHLEFNIDDIDKLYEEYTFGY